LERQGHQLSPIPKSGQQEILAIMHVGINTG
jgi:hypothetical protein